MRFVFGNCELDTERQRTVLRCAVGNLVRFAHLDQEEGKVAPGIVSTWQPRGWKCQSTLCPAPSERATGNPQQHPPADALRPLARLGHYPPEADTRSVLGHTAQHRH